MMQSVKRGTNGISMHKQVDVTRMSLHFDLAVAEPSLLNYKDDMDASHKDCD